MRIDKYLWHVRLAKTRSIANKLCAGERIRINGDIVKPSKDVAKGDNISLRDNPAWREFKVLDLPKNRLGAKLVPEYLKETTSEDALEQIKVVQEMNRQNRSFGIVGRPTKKNRRDLDRFKGD